MKRPALSILFGSAWLLAAAPGQAASGKTVFDSNNCGSCHYTQGPAREKTVADQLAKKGPELWYTGSKFQKAWLTKWLQDPKPIRPMAYNSLTQKNMADHPKLAAADAAPVADYLMGLTSPVVKAGTITPKNNPKGKLIFNKKMPCSGCHQYKDRGAVKGGMTGPSLADAGARLNPDWVYAYLNDAKTFKPVRAMPVFAGILNEKDIEAVAAYVATFK